MRRLRSISGCLALAETDFAAAPKNAAQYGESIGFINLFGAAYLPTHVAYAVARQGYPSPATQKERQQSQPTRAPLRQRNCLGTPRLPFTLGKNG